MTGSIDLMDARDHFVLAAPPTAGAVDLSLRIGALRLANPVMPASGCFGPELGRLIPARELGAVVTKTVFAGSRGGNLAHRLSEISAGMINSVGIPSRGPAGYLERQHPAYVALGVPTIVSVGGHRPEEYAPLVNDLGNAGDAYELNVSCPNLDNDGVDIGADPEAVARVVTSVRQVTDRPLIVKLPPMVSSIAECAQAAESTGADALCVSNSIPVMALGSVSRTPLLGNVIGGLSGAMIRPIVLRLVWLASRATSIPVIACGGIGDADDALAYLSVGASAFQVGTANFSRPFAMVEIVRELYRRCAESGASSIQALLGDDE